MLSPKMQRTVRVNENQLIMLSERAHYDHSQAGYLHKRSADSSKWQLRWFVLYQVSRIPIYNPFSALYLPFNVKD
jgi:hypothetical protein